MYPLISVLIPVYEVEEYLDRCVQSVLALTYEYFEMIEERIISFVSEHSRIDRERLKKLMHNTKMLTKDLGTVLVGKEAVECGLIDGEGGIRDASGKLNRMMEENVVSHR